MKFKTTRKAIIDNTPSADLFRCGYCDMHHLLYNHSPIAYTCGVYGWNFDVYSVHGLTITTGYRNMCGQSIPHDLLTKYERKARLITDDWTIPFEKKQQKVEKLLVEFIKALKGGK